MHLVAKKFLITMLLTQRSFSSSVAEDLANNARDDALSSKQPRGPHGSTGKH